MEHNIPFCSGRLALAVWVVAVLAAAQTAGCHSTVIARTVVPAEAAAVPESPAPDDGDRASFFLRLGFTSFRDDNHQAAALAFRDAISTGSLNDAGRALAYWHIFMAEKNLGRLDASRDALASFVVVAQDVLQEHLRDPFSDEDTSDFVQRFDLERRLARGRAIIAAAWASQYKGYGRSSRNPIEVFTSDEIYYFIQLAPPCEDAEDRRVHMIESQRRGGANFEHVTITCHQARHLVNYFFEMVVQPEGRLKMSR